MKKLLITMILAASTALLASCGDTPADDEVGGDWHTWRAWSFATVNDDGNDVPLAYELGEKYFYAVVDNSTEDSPETYASFDLPAPLTDISKSTEGLIFADVDKNGHTDILIPWSDDTGSEYLYVYRWSDADSDFLLDEDASYVEGLRWEDGNLTDGEEIWLLIDAQ